MSRFHRKTAPGVRDGRVQRQNNWVRSPSVYHDPQSRLVIDRRRPGEGHRHLLLQRDIERFVALIPDWETRSVGLDLICLDRKRPDCDGWYDRGAIGICAWPKEMVYELDRDWYAEHRALLNRLCVTVEEQNRDAIVYWTDDTARAYQLCHVFLHELGHHTDRMHTHNKKDNGPRGEPFAEEYALDLERAVLERYFAEFGLPS